MSTEQSALAEKKNEPITVRSLLSKDAYKRRFEEVLGKRAGQFMASIIQASNSYQLRQCEPNSVIAAAMVAASLDLPIDKNLGFAHIVPYKGVASFQMGYKGFIQLGLRSGQFKSMRDAKVNPEAFIGYDEITGDPKIDWKKLDETKEPVGYAFAWRLTNGFEKIVYWTKDAVEAHASRFSQAYRAKKKDSPWFTDFDSMALKTVIKAALAKWAPLSLEMQTAITHDEGAVKGENGEVIFLDNEPAAEVKKPIFGGTAEESHPDLEEGKPEEKKADAPPPAADPSPDPMPDREPLIDKMKEAMLDGDVSETKLFNYAKTGKLVPEGVDELWSLPTNILVKLSFAIPAISTKAKKK